MHAAVDEIAAGAGKKSHWVKHYVKLLAALGSSEAEQARAKSDAHKLLHTLRKARKGMSTPPNFVGLKL